MVSAELARILRSFGIRIAGVYLDDILLCAKSKGLLQQAIAICESICAKLGLALNDKTTGPCSPEEGIKFLGIIVRTDTCTYRVCPRYAEYAQDKLRHCLRRK